MLDLLIAAALMQSGPDPCMAVPQGATERSCPPWVLLARSEQLDYFVNPASVARAGATFEISVRIVLPAAMPRGTRSAVVRRHFDCARRVSRQLHITTFDTAGERLADRDSTPEESVDAPAPAGSALAALLTEYCPHQGD